MSIRPAPLATAVRMPDWDRARILPAPLRPYTYHILVVLLIPVAFILDIHTQNMLQQDVLGACAWVILIVCTRFSSPLERRQVWLMVGVATCVEVWSSVIWGVYRYRFGNVPLWVPPGHGLIYLFALRSIRTPLGRRYAETITRSAIVTATAWAIFGVSIEPLIFHRLDILGILWWPLFIWFMRKPSASIYAIAFFITSFLELWGTNVGNWAWQSYAPISHIPAGNPPSVISAGYCLMDFASISIAAALPASGLAAWLLSRRRPRLADTAT